MLPLNLSIGAYMIVRVSAKRGHKLQARWKEPMQVVETKSNFLFVAKDVKSSYWLTTHAQCLFPRLITSKENGNIGRSEIQATYYEMMF